MAHSKKELNRDELRRLAEKKMSYYDKKFRYWEAILNETKLMGFVYKDRYVSTDYGR